jgi:predicted hotdog family 3-hydroxylacyl-ACP dehydratase
VKTKIDNVRLDKSRIRQLIPHSGSMCLLDTVVEWDDHSIVCLSDSHRDAANPLRRNGRLSALHAFEYGAQATAVHGGVRAEAIGKTAPPGYIAALRNASLYVERLDDLNAPLEVRARRLFGEAADTVYDCEISANDKMIAKVRVIIMLRS